MPWRLRLSVERLLRLTPAVLGWTVFSIAGLCAAHECLDDGALVAAREVSRLNRAAMGETLPVKRVLRPLVRRFQVHRTVARRE